MFYKVVFSSFLIFFVEISMTVDSAVKYKGYKVFRAFPSSIDQLNTVLHLNTLYRELDFWTEPRLIGESVDVMVPPAFFTRVIDYLHDSGIQFDVMIEDIQSLIYDQMVEDSSNIVQPQRTARQFPFYNDYTPLSWKKYYRLNDIYGYMNALASRFPNFVKVITIGYSSNGQRLNVIKIGSQARNRQSKKPAIWIDAGIHAREWIAPATATYFIHQLVNGVLNNDTQITNYVRYMDWYILPVVNPDGYEYTHTSARMWRKTRSRHGLFCSGVDPNRNFGFHWNENGASDDWCSEIYAGPYAFSEPEAVAMSKFILKHNDTIKIYITMHSYGQYWLTPWGFTSNVPHDYKHLYDLAFEATEALRSVSGTDYKIGTSTNVLYAAAGGSDDWAKGVASIKYAYTVELPDKGHHGFLLPPRFIEPTSKETWVAMKTLANAVIKGLQ